MHDDIGRSAVDVESALVLGCAREDLKSFRLTVLLEDRPFPVTLKLVGAERWQAADRGHLEHLHRITAHAQGMTVAHGVPHTVQCRRLLRVDRPPGNDTRGYNARPPQD